MKIFIENSLISTYNKEIYISKIFTQYFSYTYTHFPVRVLTNVLYTQYCIFQIKTRLFVHLTLTFFVLSFVDYKLNLNEENKTL